MPMTQISIPIEVAVLALAEVAHRSYTILQEQLKIDASAQPFAYNCLSKALDESDRAVEALDHAIELARLGV